MLFVTLLCFGGLMVDAGVSYRTYLLTKIPAENHPSLLTPVNSDVHLNLPVYTIPKGNIFCRMEDRAIRSTKVWIKLGVK